ncbi:hypothetical protein MYX84_16070 [Acidobacteria bacterium AH-259-O06]|nr:hypothetical protein [Acidobacteria bacterium AH-259-L09]MDA2931435.1 hypothetical protein [Acidobacteria bacterium AH-259-O06]
MEVIETFFRGLENRDRLTGRSIRHVYTEDFRGFSIRVVPEIGAADIVADEVIRVESDLLVSIPLPRRVRRRLLQVRGLEMVAEMTVLNLVG